MRTRFIDVLEGAADLAGLTPGTTLSADYARSLTRHLNRALVEAGEQEFEWPQLELTEERFFGREWATVGTFPAGELVYVEDEEGAVIYYRALIASAFPAEWNTMGTISDVANGGTEVEITNLGGMIRLEVGDVLRDASNRTGVVATISDEVFAGPLLTRARYQVALPTTFSGSPSQSVSAQAGEPADVPTRWEETDDYPRVIPFEQDGESEIGAVFGVHDEDPRSNRRAVERKFRVTGLADGPGFAEGLGAIVGAGAPASVWVRYRRALHPLTTVEYDNAVAYVLGDVVYVALPLSGSMAGKGECYRALTSTTGNAPVTAGAVHASWERVEIPAVWRRFLELRAAADFLAVENVEQAAGFRREAALALQTAMADVAIAQQQTGGYRGGDSRD